MKYIFFSLSLLFVLSSNDLIAQKDIMVRDEGNWTTLSMVTFIREYDADFGIDVQKPVLNPIVKTLENKEIEVSGYIIPLTGKIEQSHFMLSRYPQSMCFFCGKAGPESAMQVFTKGGVKIPYTDKKIKVKGTLRINVTDMNNLLYTLDTATVIK